MPSRRQNQKAQFQAQAARTSRQRQVDTQATLERFLIICEGQKTEVNYFKSFRVPGRFLEVNSWRRQFG